MNIGIVGWNGRMNIGDDAMTRVIVRYLEGLINAESANIELYGPTENLAHYGEKKNRTTIKGNKFYNFFYKKKGLKRIGLQYILPSYFARSKDLILFGGGSIFHRKNTSKYQLNIIKEAKKRSGDVIIGALGVSLGPFRSNNEYKLVKEIIDNLNFIVVRDHRSLNLVEEMNVSTLYDEAPDLAFLLPQLENLSFNNLSSKNKNLGISLRANYVSEKRYSIYTEIISTWLSSNKSNKVKLFSLCEFKGQSDYIPSFELKKRIHKDYHNRINIVRYSYNPVDFYHAIAECSMLICMRLHAAIIAHSVGGHVIIDPYHQKCVDLANKINLSKKNILSDFKINEIMGLIFSQIQNNHENSQTVESNILAEEAKTHFRFLKDYF